MNWPKRTPTTNFALFAVMAVLVGCGVKGDPLPPEKPPELGRGRPTYRRATQELVKQGKTQESEHNRDDSDDEDKDTGE